MFGSKINFLRVLVLAFVGLAFMGLPGCEPQARDAAPQSQPSSNSSALLADAFARHVSNLQVAGQGVVSRLLKDDREGRRHQRFLLRLDSGQVLLVAHNIDLAPRVENLRVGDRVEFFGEYEWNAKGGVIHWTHHDPQGRHADGWLKHNGILYR